ncbi:MAG: Ig-like domain-containing protein [Verrucomicrobiales bacterium]|nr:Ig-like domain-containing protein [Verrucomicrobiales bacterium]
MMSYILRFQFVAFFALILTHATQLTGEPVANPDEYDTLEDEVLQIGADFGLLFNDDNDGGQIAAVEVSQPAHGALDLNADGSFTYIPDPDFSGEDSFTYAVQSVPEGVNFIVDRARSSVDFSARLIAGVIDQTRDDDSALTGNVQVVLSPPGAPFELVHIQDALLVLDDDVELSYGIRFLATVDVSAEGGDLQLDMSRPGEPVTADAAGAFTQTGNDFGLRGTVSLDTSGIVDIGVPDGEQSFDTEINDIELGGTISESNGVLTLDLPVAFTGDFDLSGNAVTATISGRIVATAPVPELIQSEPVAVIIEVDPTNDAPVLRPDSYVAYGGKLTVPVDSAGEETLVAAGASWKYLDDGSNPEVEWREAQFDDSSWSEGNAELGYGDGDEVTQVSFGGDADNKHITTYFRHQFNVADPGSSSTMTVRVQRDDGVAVYLNGKEIARDNLPDNAGFDTLASAVVNNDDESAFFAFDVNPALLVAGNNVLAVEVHQAGATSSDISFDLELKRVLAGGVLANDSDPDGDAIEAEVVVPVENGTLDILADGSFSYRSNAGFTGIDSFIYSVSNTDGNVARDILFSGSEWKFLDDGSNQGTQWRAPDFDDSSWSSGRGKLGYGNGDEQTVLSFGGDANNKHATTYFRRELTVGAPSSITSLVIQLVRDDAAAVYLNGDEVFRDSNLVADASHDQFATSAVDEAQEEVVIAIPVASLVEGRNVIAVEVHQSTANSSDLSFDMRIRASVPPFSAADPRGGTWQYLDDGSNQAGSWREIQFDDSGWASGQAPLGYGDDSIVTVIDDGGNSDDRHVTSYFRRKFECFGVSDVVAAKVRVRRDDGVALYLNGIEILRDNLATGAGFSDLALATVNGSGEEEYFEFIFDASLLQEGENVLAAELHQGSAASSDLIFDAEVLVSTARILQVAKIEVASPSEGAIDSDGDGMSDSFELAHGLIVGVDDSGEDPDGDGLSNLQESITLTDPRDAGSAFYLQSISRPSAANPGAYQLRLQTVPGVTYEIETSADGETWQVLEGSRWTAGQPTRELVINPSGGRVRLWRVKALPTQ